MRFNIFFNFPPGKAEASLDSPDVGDKNYVFRFGLIEKGKKGIRWHKAGWVDWDKVAQLKTQGLDRGKEYKVRVERKDKNNNKIKYFIIDIDKEWPIKATASTFISRPWYF